MNAPKVNEYDYINFWIATQKVYSCTEAERVQSESTAAAHDAITRLLQCIEPSTAHLEIGSPLALVAMRQSWRSSVMLFVPIYRLLVFCSTQLRNS
jgi:hypothetical protein